LERLSTLQERLYAESEGSVLIVVQAMDGGGKDSTIRRVFRGVNSQGCYVVNFKAPTPEELTHFFLPLFTDLRGRGILFSEVYIQHSARNAW
jgi:polyphosphate kinase 2 (PPK2 family)